MSTDELHLADINLNLLVALDALLDEGSVTGAARRTGVTQSAMSHSLRQLRELVGDPLLVRGAGGLVPTPRAESLRRPIRRALLDLQHALRDPPSFDPAVTTRCFRIGTGDSIAYTLLPALLGECTRHPGIDFDVVPFLPSEMERLEVGELDLGLSAYVPPLPGLRSATLFTDDFVCVVRRGHPTIRKRLTLRQFLRLPHVLISPTGEGLGPVDARLRERGESRRIALRIRYFLAAPLVVSRTDLVLTAPRRLAQQFEDLLGLELHEAPVELGTFSLDMVWHERYDADPGHRWLRQRARAAVETSPRATPASNPFD
ncbi:MAG: LysR family transcriptional regulator [Myxococcales bacterium]|nr:LysR family transcriptional regulator [Myxococcales bacterium]